MVRRVAPVQLLGASGAKALGRIEVEQGSVLYLALEDTPRRLKNRIQMMLAQQEMEAVQRGLNIPKRP